MAEALAVIGTVGAVCNIIDVIGKTITLVSDIQSRWKTADLALLSLASQLTALGAALREIQTWLENNEQNMHHQLIMDLDVSLSCCRLLVIELEAFFDSIDKTPDNPLSISSKMKVIIGGQGANDIQKFIEHQTSSLTLLLTACNCTSLSEQRKLLEEPKSRKAIDRVKADSVSLLVHWDSASFVSNGTDNMSKLSHVFDFDTEILATSVYERVLRNSLKQSIRRHLSAPPPSPILTPAVSFPDPIQSPAASFQVPIRSPTVSFQVPVQTPTVAAPAPKKYFLLLGDNYITKLKLEGSIISGFPFERNADGNSLAKCGPVLRQSCLRYTFLVGHHLYGGTACYSLLSMMSLLSGETSKDSVLLHILTQFWRHAAFEMTTLQPGEQLAYPETFLDDQGSLIAQS
ncbi:hypothetical protein CC86DRAFT_455781 [Ophiobolus disseminans]|uniref:Fungal N-terminal domain-containing protein n=1 Tax=Ophiobolus disseminans TaxID=1469910 RepID=A0A6A7A0C7_9PLEO|nr:hypothetical protein CC86DRAFT_455781 [Ophiobolus disseminans]